ncbi:hypothetical protein BGX21_006997 [Mortierella sp. AD011]|nr:hypothetical protein BGX20_003295 [Mortierella sp. AD010]KAF9398970.1 hypothetical protein BGX21_006997 [Mortierella sp. AD011]
MAMTTPAPPPLATNKTNDLDSTHPPFQQQKYQQHRTLKPSKSVDGLRRARSHTADPAIHRPRRNFDDLYVTSPSLTQTQLDTYGSTPEPSAQHVPAATSNDISKASQSAQRYKQDYGTEKSGSYPHHQQDQQHQNQQQQASQSPYQSLNVQASQSASRSTPKLTFFPQTATQSSYTSESKETRSFNGLPGQMESKPRSKTSKLKPIVLVEDSNDDHVERDQYGFKKESQWLSHHDFVIFETYYAWFHYSGAEDKCNANPGLFKKLLAQAKAKGSANEHAEVIERDLHRTFPENINFKSQITQQPDGGSHLSTENVAAIQSLRRVLLAFSLHCPTIGYCQSLNYIAGMLLLFMNEEQSFWTLSVIIQNFLPEGMYDVTMEGSNIDQAVLMTLIMERLPTIWAKFSGGATSVELDEGPGLPTVTLVTSHWFLTLFINILPVESILRVWDCFFYEGRKILFRVALTILRLHEAEISKIDDPLEVFQVVQNIPKRMIDCHKLMEACFKRMGSLDLTTKEIDRRYDQFRAKRKNARAATQASRPKK